MKKDPINGRKIFEYLKNGNKEERGNLAGKCLRNDNVHMVS